MKLYFGVKVLFLRKFMASGNLTNRKIWRLRDLSSLNCPLTHGYYYIRVVAGIHGPPTPGMNRSKLIRDFQIFSVLAWFGTDRFWSVVQLTRVNIRPKPIPKFCIFSLFEFHVNFSSSIIRLIYQIIRIINPLWWSDIFYYYIGWICHFMIFTWKYFTLIVTG